jgi:hypothetical protein
MEPGPALALPACRDRRSEYREDGADGHSQGNLHGCHAVRLHGRSSRRRCGACRILYSAHHRALVSKDQAYRWASETVPSMSWLVIQAERANRLKDGGSTTPS